MTPLLVEQQDSTLVLTMNRPDALNALSQELAKAMTEAIHSVANRSDVRSIVITGHGKSFCAGVDLKERRQLSPDGKWAQSRQLWHLCETIQASPKAVIAAINGWTLGGGFELALACDLRYAAEEAQFGWPEMTLGAYPGGGAAIMLPRLIGPARAKELFFTAKNRIGADKALAYGLLQAVVPHDQLMRTVLTCARDIESTSPLGLAAVKTSVNQGADLPWDEAVALDQKLRRPLEGTRDYEEGIQAHFEKRKPVWTGS